MVASWRVSGAVPEKGSDPRPGQIAVILSQFSLLMNGRNPNQRSFPPKGDSDTRWVEGFLLPFSCRRRFPFKEELAQIAPLGIDP